MGLSKLTFGSCVLLVLLIHVMLPRGLNLILLLTLLEFPWPTILWLFFPLFLLLLIYPVGRGVWELCIFRVPPLGLSVPDYAVFCWARLSYVLWIFSLFILWIHLVAFLFIFFLSAYFLFFFYYISPTQFFWNPETGIGMHFFLFLAFPFSPHFFLLPLYSSPFPCLAGLSGFKRGSLSLVSHIPPPPIYTLYHGG